MTGILDVLFHRFKHLLLLYGGAGDFEYWRFVFWKSHLKISYHVSGPPPPPKKKIITGPWVPEKQAVLAIWEWLHLWQVWMLLEWQWQVKGLRHTGGKCNNNTRKLHNLSGSTLFIAVMILKITPCKFFSPHSFFLVGALHIWPRSIKPCLCRTFHSGSKCFTDICQSW